MGPLLKTGTLMDIATVHIPIQALVQEVWQTILKSWFGVQLLMPPQHLQSKSSQCMQLQETHSQSGSRVSIFYSKRLHPHPQQKVVDSSQPQIQPVNLASVQTINTMLLDPQGAVLVIVSVKHVQGLRLQIALPVHQALHSMAKPASTVIQVVISVKVQPLLIASDVHQANFYIQTELVFLRVQAHL